MAILILTTPHMSDMWIELARQELGVTMTLKSSPEQQGQTILYFPVKHSCLYNKYIYIYIVVVVVVVVVVGHW